MVLTDLLPDKIPSLEELSAEPFGTEVSAGGRQPKNGVRKHFTDADKDRILMVLIWQSGNVKAAAELCGVQPGTLSKWKSQLLADRYHELRVRYEPELEKRRINGIQELVDAYTALELEVVHALGEKLDDLDPRDLAKAAQSLAVAKDRNIRDYLTLQGRPVQVTEQRNVDDIEARLVEAGVVEVDVVDES